MTHKIKIMPATHYYCVTTLVPSKTHTTDISMNLECTYSQECFLLSWTKS